MAPLMVVDYERSEVGPQRLKHANGRLLHACCICGNLDVWGDGWSTYCSEKDIDDSAPIPKFCSALCRQKGGPRASLVTYAMKQTAKDAEWRAPKTAYREAKEAEKYRHAIDQQQCKSRDVTP